MARPVIQNAVLEVASEMSVQGQTLLNIWHYQLIGATPGTYDGDDIVTAVIAEIGTGAADDLALLMRAYTNEACDYVRTKYQWVWPTRYAPVFSGVGAGPGTNVAQPLPANVAGVATLQSTLAGPAGRGRKHFGGLSVDDIDAGSITMALAGGIENVCQLMGQTIITGGIAGGGNMLPIIYHRDVPTLSQIWDSFVVRMTSRVMRRRTVGVGI